jgi:glycosyltransferase involved in cell wall biosynthesis
MHKALIVDVVIPAYNEQAALKNVLADIPKNLVREIVVCDNNSSDNTAQIALQDGATVLFEKRKGYGAACLMGINYLLEKEIQPDVIAFLDADYSDYPEQLERLLAPLQKNMADLVIGSRALGERQSGSMTLPQQLGNRIAVLLIRLIYRKRYTDLGPFRAISRESLQKLHMTDTNYGWTVEMQIKAIQKKLRVVEVPVDYRRRIGFSKISGTVSGVLGAGYKIIWLIIKYAWRN